MKPVQEPGVVPWIGVLAALTLLGQIVPSASAQQASPEAQNMDFERPARPDGRPEAWDGGGTGYEVAVDNKLAHSGQQSGRVSFTARGEPEPTAFGVLTRCIPPDEFRGRRVRYSGFVRTQDAADGVGLWLRVDGETGQPPLTIDNMSDRPVAGTNDWKKYEVVLDVPQDATGICFGLLMNGKGTAWVDDLKIDAVGNEVAVTGLGSLENLDFEAAPLPLQRPKAWFGSGDGYEIRVDKDVAHGGKQSVQLRSAGEGAPDARAFGTLARMISAANYRSGQVKLSGFVKTDRVAGWVGLWMRVDGPEPGKSLAFDNMQTSKRALTGTTGWKKYEIVLDVPKDATQICFGLLLAGKGAAWVDDVQIEPFVEEKTERLILD